MILSLVTVFVLCLLLTPACQQGVTDEDISSINRTGTCVQDTDIALHDIKGYSNAMPQVHSPSMSLSPTVTSPSVMGPAGPQHMSLTTRPLPLSPTNAPSSMPHQTNAPSSMPHQTNTPSSMPHQMNAPSSTSHQHQVLEQEPPAFGNGLASNFQPPKKLPHPGPLPQLSEGAEPGFVPMHRSLTNQSAASVFTPGVVSGQFQQQPVQRQRARTVGGSIPSPYEVPEHNGSTLSRSDAASRPSSAHSSAHHKAGPHRVPTFPPPPAHSPPPLTHSSMELRARMDSGQKVLISPPGQNTLPRTLHSPHSGGVMNHSGMKPMRSDGHFPIFESEEKNDQEKMVYIRPPLDSSMEASIHSGSSYGPRDVNGTSVNRRPSLDRAHYPYQGAMNGSVTDSEAFSSFSEMTDTRSVPSRLPQAPPHHPSHSVVADRERSMRSQGRESMFSETSIELSISSSERDMSPAWDHRGVTSDVGVGVLREASQSPENRETVSEVGAGLKGRPHHVFKQYPHLPPQPTSYGSPASIISSTAASKPRPQ